MIYHSLPVPRSSRNDTPRTYAKTRRRRHAARQDDDTSSTINEATTMMRDFQVQIASRQNIYIYICEPINDAVTGRHLRDRTPTWWYPPSLFSMTKERRCDGDPITTVTMSQGRTVSCDLLVGADGSELDIAGYPRRWSANQNSQSFVPRFNCGRRYEAKHSWDGSEGTMCAVHTIASRK